MKLSFDMLLSIRMTMFQQMLLAAVLSLMSGVMLLFIKKRMLKRLILWIYALIILYFTVLNRFAEIYLLGTRTVNETVQIDLTLFWSYAQFHNAAIRWQVYMNVFLFIPFGFMLPWCSERLQRLWKVVLIAAVFSALTEAGQYFFRIGLCETDDVIHNTLGAVIGYGYWKLLMWIQDFSKRKMDDLCNRK